MQPGCHTQPVLSRNLKPQKLLLEALFNLSQVSAPMKTINNLYPDTTYIYEVHEVEQVQLTHINRSFSVPVK